MKVCNLNTYLTMDAWYLLILSLVLLIFYIYTRIRNVYEFFERSGIPYVKPYFIFAEEIDIFLKKMPLNEKCNELHRKLGECRFGGVIFSCKPSFIIRDPELFNTMLTKDYAYFEPAILVNSNEKVENPILSKMMTQLHGNEWKLYRKRMVQLFSNIKLKSMLPVMQNSMEKLIPFFDKLSNKEYTRVKEIGIRCTTDLSTCNLFGNEESWLENSNSQKYKLIQVFRYMIERAHFHNTFPDLSKLLIKLGLYKFSLINDESIEAFKSIVLNKIPHKKIRHIEGNDFLNFLIKSKIDESAKPAESRIMSDDFIVVIAIQILIAGIVANTAVLNTCLSELSINQNVQDKLRREIEEVLSDNKELSFELLNKMTYLDMIISETLRRRNIYFRKQCLKDYRIPGTDVVIPQGSFVMLAMNCIHTDEKYYEKPIEFYPEHFTDEAKSKRPKWAFVPFGHGPRMCSGYRLAYLQLKITLIHIIKNYKLEVSPKAEKPIDMRRILSMEQPENAHSLEITVQKI